PLEARLGAVLPDVPDVADEQDHLAQPRAGGRPGRRVAALVVTLHLRPEAQDEAAAGRRLQVPADLRMHQGAARKGDGDVGADGDPLRAGRGDGGTQVWIVARLRRPDAVVAERLRVRRQPARLAQVGHHEATVDLHGAMAYSTVRRSV